jgi:preprotein translocase subunit SecF
MVNRSLNQVLMRSLSTTIVALLPVLSLLIVGSLILGATALEEFALALAVGSCHRLLLVDLRRRTAAGALEGARAAVPRPQRTAEAHVARRRVGGDRSPGRRGPGRRRGTARPGRSPKASRARRPSGAPRPRAPPRPRPRQQRRRKRK